MVVGANHPLGAKRIADHIAALEADATQAREKALEEVKRELVAQADSYGTRTMDQARGAMALAIKAIDALKSKPAQEADICPTHGPETRDGWCACYMYRQRGVEPASTPGVADYCPEARPRAACAVCGSDGEHKMSCRPANREMAYEENGLLPASKKKRQPRMPPCGHARCEMLPSGEEAHVATCPNFGTR